MAKKFISKSFLNHHILYEKYINSKNISFIDAAISFVKSLDFPELVIFGVTSYSEFITIIESWNLKNFSSKKINFNSFRWDNTDDVDPRRWSKK